MLDCQKGLVLFNLRTVSMQFSCAVAALRGCWLSRLAAWGARAGVGWSGVGELRCGFVTDSADQA